MSTRARTAPLLAVVTALLLTSCTASGDGDSPPSTDEAATESANATGDDTFSVKKSRFEVAYRLDGSVAASSAVGVDVPAGTQFTAALPSGTPAAKGQTLGSLEVAATSGSDLGKGTVAQSQRALVSTRVRSVVAPIAGVATLSPTTVVIAAPGLDVTVPLKPLQELRYRGMTFTGKATVETVLGQRESPCLAVWIERGSAGSPPAQDEETVGATGTVHCRLGADVETAAGLPAVLSLVSPALPDVVAIPLIYIGVDTTGADYVVRVRRDDAFVETPVVVGVTDGVRRVVTSGLASGDVIAPVAP